MQADKFRSGSDFGLISCHNCGYNTDSDKNLCIHYDIYKLFKLNIKYPHQNYFCVKKECQLKQVKLLNEFKLTKLLNEYELNEFKLNKLLNQIKLTKL
jgi:hypothetical protein